MTDMWLPGGGGFGPTQIRPEPPIADAVTVTIDGWSTTSRADVPSDGGFAFELDSWSGWWGGRTPTTDTQQSPTGDGTLDGSGTFSGRTITLNGQVLANRDASTMAALHAAGDVFSAVLAGETRTGTLRVEERMLGLTRECDVRLAGTTPDFGIVAWGLASWGLYLYAPDPLRYGVGATRINRGQTVRVENRGTAMSRPMVDLFGPLTNPTISYYGGTLRLTLDLPAGSAVTVDMRRRVVLNQQGGKTFTPTAGGWPHVLPGGGDITLGGTGTGYAYVRRASAWM